MRLILQTQGRLEGFSVLSHLLRPTVKSTLLSTNDLKYAIVQVQLWKVREVGAGSSRPFGGVTLIPGGYSVSSTDHPTPAPPWLHLGAPAGG